jgi:hypothetical protein
MSMLSYFFLAFSRCSINSGNGLGLRFTALGSTRPGRFPTVLCAIKINISYNGENRYYALPASKEIRRNPISHH